jgi:hypothetical protein
MSQEQVSNVVSERVAKVLSEMEKLKAEVEQLIQERDEARAAILTFGNGADFDWDVLRCMTQVEDARTALKTITEVLAFDLNDVPAPWMREAVRIAREVAQRAI